MPKSTIAGHPLHPLLIVAPSALLPFALVMDVMHRATDNDRYANCAYYSLVGALVGGAAAAVAGTMDYLTIAPRTAVKRTANMHAVINGAVMVAAAANAAQRRRAPEHRGGSLVLSAAAALGVMVSGWFGGKLVYEQGMRVRGASPVARAPEARLPGSAAMQSALQGLERLAPASGPAMHR